MMSMETPVPFTTRNPFDFEPSTPRVDSRVGREMSQRVIENLDTLCAPAFEPAPRRQVFTAMSTSQSPRFNAALERMRNGSALQRLREQRDADTSKANDALDRLKSFTPATPDKGAASPQVNLGRQGAVRRSSLARSA